MQGVIDKFLDHLAAEGRSPNTLAAYRADLRGFHSFLQAESPRVNSWHCATELHLAAYWALLQQKGIRPATVSRKAVVLRRFFGFLGKDIHPLKNLPVHQRRNEQPPVAPSSEEMETILAQMAASSADTARRDRALLALLRETGAQVSEVVGLNWGDFDESTAEIVLNRGNRRQRTVVLSPATADAVSAYVAQAISGRTTSPMQDPLLRNQKGKRLTRQGVWWILREWATAAGIEDPVTPRLLRSAGAVRLLQAGGKERPLLLLDGLPPATDQSTER